MQNSANLMLSSKHPNRKLKKQTGSLDKLRALPATIIGRQMRAWRLWSWVVLLLALGGNIIAIQTYRGSMQGQSQEEWLPEVIISSLLIFILFLLVYLILGSRQRRMQFLLTNAIQDEYGYLRSAIKRARALQEMAKELRATLNLDRVLDSALTVCTVGLQEMGIPEKHVVAGVLLYEDGRLAVVAHRRLHHGSRRIELTEETGAIGSALSQAEPIVTTNPADDPGLSMFESLRRCQIAVTVPLRVGFQLFGVMLVGSEIKVHFDQEYMELFHAVADQAVIALQNAQLYQNLEQEKHRLLEAESEARKELARDLHDGPTQSVSAISMRINFVRSLITIDLEQAQKELFEIEDLAKRTAKEIRGMLFTLRPLVLETQGLAAAIETVMERIQDEERIQLRLLGGEFAEILNPKAQGVLFYIIEEALNNARKYSQAHTIEIRFWKEQNLFVARVQDDGVGFDVDSVTGNYESRGSLGMVNMRERAEMIDGSIRLDSSPGRGTVITVVVPLDKQGVHAG